MLSGISKTIVIMSLAVGIGCGTDKPTKWFDDGDTIFIRLEKQDSTRSRMILCTRSTGGQFHISIPTTVVVTIDGKEANLPELKTGMIVVLEPRDKTIAKIEAYSSKPTHK